MTVKWQRKGASDANFTDISNTLVDYTSNTDATYTFTFTANDKGASYRAVFTAACNGEAVTNAATINLNTLTGFHIPDANFAAAIRSNCLTCIDACDNLTAAAANQTDLSISNKGISNLTGIEYFTSLEQLFCYGNLLTTLPPLPNSLQKLGLNQNQLTSLPTLPSGLTELYCGYNQLTSLPTLPSGLTVLWSHSNQLTNLPALPSNLQTLACFGNSLTCLPTLPNSLTVLFIDPDKVLCLPNSVANLEVRKASFQTIPTPPLCTVSVLTAPSILNPVCTSNNLTLIAKATGIGTMTIKWQRKGATDANFSDIANTLASYTSNSNASYQFTPAANDNGASYHAFFTAACSSEAVTNATILNFSNITLNTPSVSNVKCNDASTGAIDLTVNGGTSPYNYKWSNNATTQDLTNIKAGAYTVVVTDANSCTATLSTTVTQNTAIVVTASSCQYVYYGYGSNCTNISATASGGGGTFTYKWSPGNLSGATVNVCPTKTTTYTVTATDQYGCTGTSTVRVEVIDVTCQKTKVKVCHDGTTLCVDKIAVPDHLAHGDKLGTCGTTACGLTLRSAESNIADHQQEYPTVLSLQYYPYNIIPILLMTSSIFNWSK